MTGVETLALARAVKDDKAARAEVQAGTYHVDFAVHIVGALVVGADTTRAPTCNVPWPTVAALLWKRLGAVAPCTEETLIGLLREASETGEDKARLLREECGLHAAEAAVKAAIAEALPRTPVFGAVRAALTTTQIAAPMAAAAK